MTRWWFLRELCGFAVQVACIYAVGAFVASLLWPVAR